MKIQSKFKDYYDFVSHRYGADPNIIYVRVPVLRDYGFPTIVLPEQMWQDIYQTLSSVLRHDPDKVPPVTIGNDDRIHAAGFDLKTSFRHPINEKKLKKNK